MLYVWALWILCGSARLNKPGWQEVEQQEVRNKPLRVSLCLVTSLFMEVTHIN